MRLHLPDRDGDLEVVKRKFIVKTKRVLINDDFEDKKTMFLHMFVDTTQISQLEEARAQNRYQRQMLANVSHEFRTPLNAMNMSLSLVSKRGLSPQDEKFLHIARSSCGILGFLVEDILDHAKIETGVFEIQDSTFCVTEVADEMNEIFELQAKSKRIQLEFIVSDPLRNLLVRSDKQRLKQVMMNLISNALKFTDHGYIRVIFEKVEHDLARQDRFEEEKVPNGQLQIDSYESSLMDINQELTTNNRKILDCVRNGKYFFLTFKDKLMIPNAANDRQEPPPALFDRPMTIRMTVKDTGVGIPLKDQGALFKLFGKVSSNHNRNKTG